MISAETIRLTILVDNQAEGELGREHGLSIWIEADSIRILFDTGQGMSLAENARRLRCDLTETDLLVLSHGHYDHTGGIPHVLETAPAVRLCCHPGVVRRRFGVRPGEAARDIAMPEPVRGRFEKFPATQIDWITAPRHLFPGVGISGPIPRTHSWEDVGGPFFLDPEGTVPDAIEDDMSLWLETDRGLVIVAGCCHAGLCNTVEHIQKTSGIDRIQAIVGGLHLQSASAERLERTCRAIELWDVQRIAPCHCTGENAAGFLRGRFGRRVESIRGGSVLSFEA